MAVSCILPGRGYESFLGAGNVLYLDLDGYMGINICKTFTEVYIFVHILLMQKSDLNKKLKFLKVTN